jgi:hypothetical protein
MLRLRRRYPLGFSGLSGGISGLGDADSKESQITDSPTEESFICSVAKSRIDRRRKQRYLFG